MEKDDTELIQCILSGDEVAFSNLVRKYQKSVHALVWRKIGDFHIAEEITQDTFLQVHKKLTSLKNPNQFAGWLYVIADRLCRAWFRKNYPNMQSLETVSEGALQKTAYSDYICEQREDAAAECRREIVQKLLAKLPESERTVMVLYYLGEMNCEEISKFLGVSPNTIKSRLRRGRERLRAETSLISETLGSIQLPSNLIESIMQNIDAIKQTSPSGGKPLLPLAGLGSSVILVVLLMGASNQIVTNFQQPYSVDAESETIIEIVDAPVVLDIQSKPNLQNRVGSDTNPGESSNNGLPTETKSMQNNIAQDTTLWHLPEGAIGRFGKGRVKTLAYFPDGTRLAVKSTIGIWIYDVRTGEALDLLTGDIWGTRAMAFSPDGSTVAVTSRSIVHLIDLHTMDEKGVLAGHRLQVYGLTFNPSGEILASGSSDGTIRLWDTDTGELLRILTGHTGFAELLAYSRDGKMLASAWSGHDNTIYLWDVHTGKLLRTITEHPSRISSIDFSEDSLTLASASWNGEIHLWDVHTGERKQILTGHTIGTASAVYSPDGKTLVSGSRDKTIRLWDMPSGNLRKTLTGHLSAVRGVIYSPDGSTLASRGDDETVRLWDADTGKLLKTITGHTFLARSVAFSPDGSTFASSEMADYTIPLRDTQTGELLKTFVGHTDYVCSVIYSPDGNTLASGSWNGPIRVWDVQTGELLKTLIGHERGAPSLAYSSDSATLVSGGWDHTIRLWDVQTGQLLKTFAAQTSGTNSGISLSPDGDTLAVGNDEHVIRLWDTRTGKIKATLKGHTRAVTAVAFSPNNYLLASGSADKTICLWHADTGEHLLTFPEQSNSVKSIAFSPDGQTIASGTFGTIYMSDLATGKHIATLTGHADRVQSVAFSPDGKMLVSGSNEGTVILWDLTRIRTNTELKK